MKTVVVYTSQTGFTKRYAGWIAEAAGAECLTLSEAKKRDLSGYDAIVYGGWAKAGGISGLGWFKRGLRGWTGKKCVVFCVGGSPLESPHIDEALRQNFTAAEWNRIHAFYCPGGFCYERMSAASKLLMKLFLKTLRAKKDKTEEEKAMVRMIASSYDISDRRYIEPILECLME